MANGEDKNFIRMMAAINGFRVKYNKWPTHIRTYPGIIEDIENYVLGPESFKLLTNKLKLIKDNDYMMLAEDTEGNKYDYESNGFPEKEPDIQAYIWLDIEPRKEI